MCVKAFFCLKWATCNCGQIYSVDFLPDHMKIRTNENYPLYKYYYGMLSFPKYSHILYIGASLLKKGQLSTGHIVSKNSAPPIIIIRHTHQIMINTSTVVYILR